MQRWSPLSSCELVALLANLDEHLPHGAFAEASKGLLDVGKGKDAVYHGTLAEAVKALDDLLPAHRGGLG